MQNNQVMALGLIALGILLFFIGFIHKMPTVNQWDKATFKTINRSLSQYTNHFIYLWHLGTTPVAIVLIATTLMVDISVSITVLMVYLTILLLENQIKRRINRQRPFLSLPNCILSQPTQPSDASFPSGDAMRVCFLAVVYPMVFELHWGPFTIACLLAFSICVSRIALGAHYPLDVIGGAGLGLFGAGCVVLILEIPFLNTVSLV